MHLTRFFRVGWTIQLLVGLALFSVSFLIELAILRSFLAGVVITTVLTAALELGKAVAIIWHRYLSLSEPGAYPVLTRLVSATFRFGLLALSVLCSVLYIGVQLDRPHLAQVRADELAVVDARLAEDLTRVDADAERHALADEQRRRETLTAVRALHQERTDTLAAQLRAEMDNEVRGVFKGPRYQEIQERLARAETQRDTALQQLAADQIQEARQSAQSLARDREQARQALITAAQEHREAIRAASFETDDRANHPLVASFMRATEALTGQTISPPQFVVALALFIAVLTELGIWLAFDTVTLVMVPALQAQHREEVTTEALMAEVSGTATRDDIRHREALERIRKSAEQVVEKARVVRGRREAA